jgi:multimeric flavodoxin WrbA
LTTFREPTGRFWDWWAGAISPRSTIHRGHTRWRASTFASKCRESSSARKNSGNDIASAFPTRCSHRSALLEAAWQPYSQYRKAPHTRRAGPGFADPDYQLSADWIAASEKIKDAERQQKDPAAPSRILLINGATRSEHTCPGETSKTWRLVTMAREIFAREQQLEVEILDLSRLASEYGRVIYPCKTCVSTAMPLCHWPCSCYPNHALGQVQDWMNDIYAMWTAAHGVMIVCPVNWYGPPSGLKLMMDRMVCADGGNPDPTSTHGKDVEEAKALEIADWPYPQHLPAASFRWSCTATMAAPKRCTARSQGGCATTA